MQVPEFFFGILNFATKQGVNVETKKNYAQLACIIFLKGYIKKKTFSPLPRYVLYQKVVDRRNKIKERADGHRHIHTSQLARNSCCLLVYGTVVSIYFIIIS